jgi:hypothetical protein
MDHGQSISPDGDAAQVSGRSVKRLQSAPSSRLGDGVVDVIVEVCDSMNRVRPDHSLDDIHWQPSQPGQPQIIPTASGRCKRISSAGPLTADRVSAAGPFPTSFNRQLLVQKPIRTTGGTVRIPDSTMFPAATTIAAAFIEVEQTGKFADISLRQLLPFNPYQLLRAHAKIDQSVLADSPTCKTPVGPRPIPSGGPPARSGPPSSVILRPWRPGAAPYLKPMAERRSRRPLVSTIHHRLGDRRAEGSRGTHEEPPHNTLRASVRRP